MDKDKISCIVNEAKIAIRKATSINSLLHDIKPICLGKESTISKITTSLKDLNIEEKRLLGPLIQLAKKEIESELNKQLDELQKEELNKKLKLTVVDGTLSTTKRPIGSIHPITQVSNEVIEFFKKYGCQLHLGSEIETSWYNFDALNVLKNHPARQMHDTFYVNGKETDGNNYLLRTHTTCIDIKTMQNTKNSFKSVSIGKTFRKDSDRTHSPMFHQAEFLEVSKTVHLGHLKTIITMFLQEFFNSKNIKIRMRPSYFPFTEPSIEVDICCRIEDNRTVVDPMGTNFMEIIGCGVLRKTILEKCEIDSSEYTAIAAGFGIERLAMLKYGMNDIRKFFESDLKWMEEESFDISVFT